MPHTIPHQKLKAKVDHGETHLSMPSKSLQGWLFEVVSHQFFANLG